MAYQANSNKFASNRPALKSTGTTSTSKDKPEVTHFMVTAKDDQGNSSLVEGVFITENQYGLTVYLKDGVTIPSGRYFINKRKAKVAE